MIKYGIGIVIVFSALLFALPAVAKAATTIDGWMQGFNCVIHGHKCPVDSLDPHLALESDFVLYLDGGEYFLLPNIDKIIKAKYVHQEIRVTGKRNPKYATIEVNTLQVRDGNGFKTVWSKKMAREEWEKRQKEFYEDAGG